MRSAFFDPLTRQPENIELEQTTLLQFRLFSDCQVLAYGAEALEAEGGGRPVPRDLSAGGLELIQPAEHPDAKAVFDAYHEKVRLPLEEWPPPERRESGAPQLSLPALEPRQLK